MSEPWAMGGRRKMRFSASSPFGGRLFIYAPPPNNNLHFATQSTPLSPTPPHSNAPRDMAWICMRM